MSDAREGGHQPSVATAGQLGGGIRDSILEGREAGEVETRHLVPRTWFTEPFAAQDTMKTPSELHEPVRFHRLTDEYGVFSTFSRHPVVIDGIEWPTCEHFYQAAKFTADAAHVLRIRQAPSPRRAAALGRIRNIPVRSDWDAVRVDVMRTGMRAKFVQHPHLTDLLLSTPDRPLIETTPRDRFWGIGADGTGRNIKGQILTELRRELGNSSPAWDPPHFISRRWVGFGATTIVLSWQQRSGTGLVARAVAVLRHTSAGTEWHLGQRDDPDPHVLVEVASEGRVMLRSPGLDRRDDVAAALTRAATEPIIWVNDPDHDWPRP